MINYYLFKIITRVALFLFIIILLIISLISIYENKNKIANYFYKIIINDKNLHLMWSEEIAKGGYILFIRHSFRKDGENPAGDFYNVWSYDALELYNLDKKKLKAENSYLKDSTCLTDEGKILAKTTGDYFKILNINYDLVISSPSCRARQHALLAFDNIDKFYNELVHYGPWNEDIKVFENNIKKVLFEVAPSENKNTVIVSHNGVITPNIFDEYPFGSEFYLKQGGFYLIKITDNKIILKHTFDEFYKFSSTLLTRPKNKNYN